MKLILPRKITAQWRPALRSAGRREIGGVLLGEFVNPETFRLLEITVQTDGGTVSHFVRDPKRHEAAIQRFFEQTGHQYQRFNYLGEWHSHPSFGTHPSSDDIHSMYGIVRDQDVGANFAILLIVRLPLFWDIEARACVVRLGAPVEEVQILHEGVGEETPSWRRVGRVIRRVRDLALGR